MVAIIGTLLGFLLCIAFGQFSLAMIIAGLSCVIGIRFPLMRKCGVFLFVTALSISLMMSSVNHWTFVLPAFFLFCTKEMMGGVTVKKHLWVILLPMMVFSYSFQDKDFCALISVVFVLTLPNITNIKVRPSTLFQKVILIVSLFVIGTVFFIALKPKTKGKIAIFDAGVWAKASTPFNDVNSLNIETVYAYSELKQMLDAEIISPANISNDYSEIWMITPTIPLNDSVSEKILKWVRGGGRLIIVTDHTDLFGHARIVNSFLSKLSCQTSYTSFFPLIPDRQASSNMGEDCWLKTSNIQSGVFLWPQLTARWINESPDYSNRSFFGPMSLTSDDELGCRIISGSKSFGRGRIVLFGDSTSLANFSVYQPHVLPMVEKIRTGSWFACMLPLLYGMLSAGIMVIFLFRYSLLFELLPLLGLFAATDIIRIPVVWKSYVNWSGETKTVMEFGEPDRRLSTAYAICLLSGRKPRWVDNPSKCQSGIWVGYSAPPNKDWRWIDLSDANGIVENYDHALDPILSKVTEGNPYLWNMHPDTKHVKIGQLWTDDAMGDWWFDQGVSDAKKKRILAWIAWLSEKAPPCHSEPVFTQRDKSILYRFRIGQNDWQSITLPFIPFGEQREIYLGRGVSASIVNVEKQPMLLGTRPFTESWNCVNTWLLVPQNSSPQNIN